MLRHTKILLGLFLLKSMFYLIMHLLVQGLLVHLQFDQGIITMLIKGSESLI